jgi:hypothetical protein
MARRSSSSTESDARPKQHRLQGRMTDAIGARAGKDATTDETIAEHTASIIEGVQGKFTPWIERFRHTCRS